MSSANAGKRSLQRRMPLARRISRPANRCTLIDDDAGPSDDPFGRPAEGSGGSLASSSCPALVASPPLAMRSASTTAPRRSATVATLYDECSFLIADHWIATTHLSVRSDDEDDASTERATATDRRIKPIGRRTV